MKTKLFKRLGATVLALGMALSVMAIPTSAIESTDTGTITVNNVGPGVTVNAYQVMSVNYNYEPVDQPVEPVYVWVDSVADWLEHADNAYGSYINDENNAVTDAFEAASSTDLAAFYDALANYVVSQNMSASGSATNNSQTEDADVTIEGLAMGNYLLLVTGGTRLYSPASATIAPYRNNNETEENTSDDYWDIQNVEVDLKSSNPDVEKTVDDTSVQIGQTVNFTITADVPQYPANATQKTFTITDTMTSGLALTENAPVVVGVSNEGAETPLVLDTHYTYTPNGQSFTIDFNYDEVSSYTSIKVTYSAIVTADAVTVDDVTNTAKLTYDTNPYVDSNYETDGDDVEVYTYGIDVTKTDKDDVAITNNPATFTLSTNNDGSNLLSFVGSEGSYRLATADDQNTTTDLQTSNNGTLVISGLTTGTYYLTETVAPQGFVLPLDRITEVVISDTNANGLVDTTVEEQVVDGDDEYVDVRVENISEEDGVPSLPTTGGMGTILFTTVGLVLVGGAAILLVVMYKRKKEN